MVDDCVGRNEYVTAPNERDLTVGGDRARVCLAATADACADGGGDPGDAAWEVRERMIRRMDEVEMKQTEEPATIFLLVRQRS